MLRRPTKQTRRNREGWDFCFPYLGIACSRAAVPIRKGGGERHIIGGIT